MELVTQPCTRCGQEIPAERLEAMPETELCVRCSADVGGEFKIIAITERTSKPGSLKLNYGGCSIKKVRRRLKPKSDAPQAG